MLNRLKKLFGKPLFLYTRKQQEAVERHVRRCFGDMEEIVQEASEAGLRTDIVQLNRVPEAREHMVSHERKSSDLKVDIHLFAPKTEHRYYSLCTVGAGAYRMNVPEGMDAPERAEFVMRVPPEWQVDDPEDPWRWVQNVMKMIALDAARRKLIYYAGYIVDFGRPLCEEASFSAILMAKARGLREDAECCQLPDGERVAFYGLHPIYREELEFSRIHGPSELAGRINAVGGSLYDPRRPNSCKNCAMRPLTRLYNGNAHRWKIVQNQIAVDEIAAYQVPAVFLRWMIEHDLAGEEFLQWQQPMAEAIKRGEYAGDLREFVRDELGGVLVTGWFSEEGEAFGKWYFSKGRLDQDRYRMADIDAVALEYFGEDRFYGEMNTDGYLFLPWNEEIYQAMAKRMDQSFERWKNGQ